MKSDKKFKLSQFRLALFIASYMFLNSLIFNSSVHKLILPVMHCVCTFLLVSVLDFYSFRERLLDAMTKVSAVSFVIWIIDLATGIGGSERSILWIFKRGSRLASIYQEPGSYQIILFSILLLFVDELVKVNFANIKYYIRKFGIIIAAILACQSSMGYMCLLLLTMILFFYNKSAKRNVVSYSVFLVVGIIMALLMWQSDTIQKKIDPDNYNRHFSSLAERTMDSIILFRMSFISPLTGIGRRTPVYYQTYQAEWRRFKGINFKKGLSDEINGINGVLNIAVCFGWPFLLFLVYRIVLGIRKMKPGVPPVLVAFVLLLSLSNETYALNISTWLYIFTFNSYDGGRSINEKHNL